MKTILTACLLLVLCHAAFAQGKYDANWVFGINAGVDFRDTSHPVPYFAACNNFSKSASISDSLGNLLFYIASSPLADSSGFYKSYVSVRSNNQSIIDNGDSLKSAMYTTNGALFLPSGSVNNKYTLLLLSQFDTIIGGQDYHTYDLYFNQISYIQNAYHVREKNKLVAHLPSESKIASVRHANGKDWWIILHASCEQQLLAPTNYFYEFLLTDSAIIGPNIQPIGFPHSSLYSEYGQMTFSQKGNRLAVTSNDQGIAELFSFDRCSGSINNFVLLDSINQGTVFDGCEFSLSETEFYVTGPQHQGNVSINGVYQYNLDTTDTKASRKVIWEGTGVDSFNFGQMKLAPDNKIYLSVADYLDWFSYPNIALNYYNQYLWIINNPDSAGINCHFQAQGLYLGDSSACYYGLPNTPNYNLGKLSDIWVLKISGNTFFYNCDTAIQGVSIGADSVPGVTYEWRPASGISNLHSAKQNVRPTQSQWYYVTLTDTSIQGTCNSRTDSVYVEVRTGIYSVALPKDTSVCKSDSVTIGYPPLQNMVFDWQAVTGIDSIHLPKQTVRPTESKWYFITLTDTSVHGNCNSRRDSIYVQVRVCDTTSIENIMETHVKVYPNPASSQLTVETSSSISNIFYLYDCIAHPVLQQSLMGNKCTIDISMLSQGLYFYRIGEVAGKLQISR